MEAAHVAEIFHLAQYGRRLLSTEGPGIRRSCGTALK
jgi:hypothetical protein